MVGKVCVIGGGPSGLGVLCWFAKLKREGKVRIRKTQLLSSILPSWISFCICLCISSSAFISVFVFVSAPLHFFLYQPLSIFICICLCICPTNLSSSRGKARWEFGKPNFLPRVFALICISICICFCICPTSLLGSREMARWGYGKPNIFPVFFVHFSRICLCICPAILRSSRSEQPTFFCQPVSYSSTSICFFLWEKKYELQEGSCQFFAPSQSKTF